MSTFDASTPDPRHAASSAEVPAQDVAPDPGFGHPAYPPGTQLGHTADQGDEQDDGPILSTLDLLRASAAEEDDREPITVMNPKETIRLTLRTDLTQRDIQRWSNRALEKKDREKLNRKGGAPNLTKLSAVVMYAAAIAETCIQVEVWSRAKNDWDVVADERSGEPLTFADSALRQVLGGLDTVSAVKRAFNNSEPALMTAGGRLIDASGFGDDDDLGDDEDPLAATAEG